MHVLRAADQRGGDRGEGGEARAQGRRVPVGVRAVVSGEGARLRRSERSRIRSVAAVEIAARRKTARRPRHEAGRDVSLAADAGMTTRSLPPHDQITADLLRPLQRTSWRFYLLVAFLGSIVAMGGGTWFYQMWN